ncbi:MAG: hypothetical protein IJQ17_00125 [Oscillospiraceae bacterium]|nr:hypothetical protein [Oscillospiraceae bacterium]MBQ6973204.1 hypothetical protein [Oscillospiraceae bacterium]
MCPANRPHPVERPGGNAPTVGADAYPKGTGSGSRSFLAGRHWPLAARTQVTILTKGG